MRSEDPVEARIEAVERRQDALEKRLNDLDYKIDQNAETTNAIKRDTAQLIQFFRASKLGLSILQWCATMGGGLIVAYAAWKGLSGGH